MIHQVKASHKDVAVLRQLVEFQMQLLELAATQTVVDLAGLERAFSGTHGGKASDPANWVKRHSALLSDLNRFAAHTNSTEKLELVNQLRADVNLLFAPVPQRLQAAFTCRSDQGIDPPWKCAAGSFCRRFYEIWGQSANPGFPEYLLTGISVTGQSYTRWDFIDGFLAANDGLYICAICDATAFRTQVDSRSHTGIEHFFPKSVYPHLAMHPMNLVPICTYCNNIKRDADLMQLCSTTSGIKELLLPYQERQPGLSQMAYVEVAFRTPSVVGLHPLEIKLKPASAFADSTALISNFGRLYHVEDRWNNELDQIGEQVFRRIQQFLMADVQMGNTLTDVDFLLERLELLMALTSKVNLGKDPFGLATIWMLKHHIDMLRRERNEALIYNNLLEWAKDHRSSWAMLREHIDELYLRVPGTAAMA